MAYDFDTYINRRNTNCYKWDIKKYSKPNMIPLWVADMDFTSPTEVIDALVKRVKHGVFGYTFPPKELEEVIVSRLRNLYNWVVQPEWLVWLPGVVSGFNIACKAIAKKNDIIATTVPVYHPMLQAPDNNSQRLEQIPMIIKNNRWTFDPDRIKQAFNNKIKMFLLCNPHNPTGTMFTKSELLELARICEKNNIIICSDEIHCDLILEDTKKHIPIASLSPEIGEKTITLMAPSKTFNLAGMGCGFAIIPNRKLREQYTTAMQGIVPFINTLNYTAALAAYKYGNQWLTELLNYLRGNLNLIQEYVEKTSGFSMARHEATYLAWIDITKAKIKDPIKRFEDAGVGFSDGAHFNGEGFIRMNFGCSRSLLKEALERVYNIVNIHNLSN